MNSTNIHSVLSIYQMANSGVALLGGFKTFEKTGQNIKEEKNAKHKSRDLERRESWNSGGKHNS